MSQFRNLMMTKIGGGRLPSEYQEVEYIQSTGEQYIYTGITADMFSEWIITLQFTEFDKAQLNGGYDNYTRAVDIGLNSDGTWFVRNGGIRISTTERASATKHTIKLNRTNNTAVLDDTISLPMSYSASTARTMLFARDASGMITLPCHERMYDNVFVDANGGEIQHLIPCYRKSDRKGGLYDIISNSFFQNQGTGADFILGPEV